MQQETNAKNVYTHVCVQKETYKCRKRHTCVHTCVSLASYTSPKETCIRKMRPTKETCVCKKRPIYAERDLQKRPIYAERDLQKRPFQVQRDLRGRCMCLWHHSHVQKRPVCVNRDLVYVCSRQMKYLHICTCVYVLL